MGRKGPHSEWLPSQSEIAAEKARIDAENYPERVKEQQAIHELVTDDDDSEVEDEQAVERQARKKGKRK